MQELEPYWILVTSKPAKETWACLNIEKQGSSVYMPMARMVHIRKRKKVIRTLPLFSRYIFVQIVSEWRFLLGTFGVAGIIMKKNAPARVHDWIIEELKAREDDEGYVTLEPSPEPSYKKGQRVLLRQGPFKGTIGIYDKQSSKDRNRVLLEVMGGEVPVYVSDDSLAELTELSD